MTRSETTVLNLDKILKETIPKDLKITRETMNLIKNLFQDFIDKISVNSSVLSTYSSKHALTEKDVLEMINLTGLNRYVLELKEEQKKTDNEETEFKKISK